MPERKKLKVVAAVIRDKDGRILITQRGPGMDFSGKWEFPGGKIKEGEDPKSALKREIAEELGLDINVGEKLLAWDYVYDFADIDFIAFDAKVIGGVFDLLEHQDAIWTDALSMDSYDWVPADRELVSKLSANA